MTGSYEWSLDLENWNASGASVDGTTVNISASPNTPVSNVTTVEASIAGVDPAGLYMRVVATQN